MRGAGARERGAFFRCSRFRIFVGHPLGRGSIESAHARSMLAQDEPRRPSRITISRAERRGSEANRQKRKDRGDSIRGDLIRASKFNRER